MNRFALVACMMILVAGIGMDVAYQRSTPDPVHAQGTIVDFERRHSKQVYPVFEFQDAAGRQHRVVSTTQQIMSRFAAGDQVPIAYSKYDPAKARIDTLWFDHRWLIGALIVVVSIVIAGFRERTSPTR